jgi:hypothetical protein
MFTNNIHTVTLDTQYNLQYLIKDLLLNYLHY